MKAYEAKDYTGALREWQPLAEKGDPHAQYNLGLLYAQGKGVPQDHAAAAKWYEKAAEQGVPAAQYNLGIMYSNGQGVPQDIEKAAEWYRKAAGSGIADAANNLGTIFNEGEGSFQNYAEAEKWYRNAAEKGIASAQFNLAVIYDLGQGVERDFAEAVRWYRKAADQGLASAMTNLGILYYNGQGVERDVLEAYVWFALAAAAGDQRGVALEGSTRQKLKRNQLAQAKGRLQNWRPQVVQVDHTEFAQMPKTNPEPAPGAQLAVEQRESAERDGASAVAQPVSTGSSAALSEPVSTIAAQSPSAATGETPGVRGEASGEATPSEPAESVPAGPNPSPVANAAPSSSPPAGNGADTWTGVERVVAVGDVHGDYEQFFGALRMAELIDSNGNWTGGKAHLVQTGDILDRGPDSRKVMQLLMHLEPQAETAGGRVHVLLGNHEAMNLYGDYRFVSPGEIAAFSPDLNPEDIGSADRQELRRKARPQFPSAGPRQIPGAAEHHAALSPAGKYGKWLAAKNSAVKINDTLFVHAGISPKYASMPLSEINQRVREELNNLQGLHGGIVLDEEGPLWYRGLASGDESELREHVDAVLENFGVNRVVIGHSYANAAITPRFGGKVVLIDIGLPRAYDNVGKMGVFELENGKAYALHRGKRLELPTHGGQPMLEYLKQAASADPSPSPLASRIEELERSLQ